MAFENNAITVSGIIFKEPEFSYLSFNQKFYKFEIKTKRLSETSDYLRVTISETVICDRILSEGLNIKITGQLRSYNSIAENKNKLILTIFAKKLLVGESESVDENRVLLVGHMCRAPVYRTTPFGREIADILIAVNRKHNKSDYIPVIAWGQNARFCQHLNIGQKIRIQGRFQSRIYTKALQDNRSFEKTAFEVSASKIDVIEPVEEY